MANSKPPMSGPSRPRAISSSSSVKPLPLPQLVRERVDRLMQLAAACVKKDESHAIRYVQLACRLSSRHRLPLGRARKRLFCADCHRPWIAGYNLTIRLRPRTKRAEYKCVCGKSRFFVYSAKKPGAVRPS